MSDLSSKRGHGPRRTAAGRLVAGFAVAGFLGGCSLAPQFVRPTPPVADAFAADAGGQAGADVRRAVDTGWRDFFPDPRLQALVQAALANNRDLRSAALRIEEARALYNIQSADLLPNLNGVAGGSRGRGLASGSGGQTVVSSNYQVGLSLASFELDFFGRVRSLNDAALAQYLATAEARQSVQISLIAAVAQTYLSERSFAEQLALAQSTIQGRQTAYELARQRFDVGASSALDLRLAETLVLSARVAVVTLVRQQAQAQNALTLLVGQPQKDLPPTQTLSSEKIVTGIPAGLPSDLLTNRPDIRAAEQRLRAANANIGAARAAFFPRISLTAGLGTASPSLSGLFDAGSRTWSFAPQLLLPIFDAGRNRTNLTLAQVRTDLAVADYEKTIQVAFREVADALAARSTLEEQLVAQQAFLDAQADRLRLADLRYKNGVASSLEVLDAQRDLFAAQQSLVQTRLLRLTNAVDLYRALGGGIAEQSAPVAAK
ncbi:MAG: efflux transporter outer membrane subunit [Herminiimonas sp.]|nr:efflux transporter outer membrane subunit [Herminiimonas sp.]